MADVTRPIRNEAFLDLSYLADVIPTFWRVRLPFAMEARKRELDALDGEGLADLYKLLVELRDQEKVLYDRSITAGASAQSALAGESRSRMGLQGTYRSAASREAVEATSQSNQNLRQMRAAADAVVNTRAVPQEELDEIAAATTAARQLWTTTPGDFNTKLANLMATAKANTEALVKGKTGLHAEAIALQIVRDMELVVNPRSGEEKAAFDAAALSIYGTYGITPVRDPETGEMIPPAVKRATDVEMQTSIEQRGETTMFSGSGTAPGAAPGAAQTFTEVPAQPAAQPTAQIVPASPVQVQAAASGTVLTDPQWTAGLPVNAVPVQGADGQVYARLWDGSYILHPRTLFAGNVGALEDFKSGNEPLRASIQSEIDRLRDLQDKARERSDSDQMVPDFLPKAPSRLTEKAGKYGAWYAKLTPDQKRAEDTRRSEFLKTIAPTPRLSPATKAADEVIAESREAVEGDFAAAPTATEAVNAIMARKKAEIDMLSRAYLDTEAAIKQANLDKDDEAAKAARGRWFTAYMEATKDIPPSAQEAFADKLALPPEARKAVGTIIKSRIAPDAATREADADEAIRTEEAERATGAAIDAALKGDLAPDARTQGEKDFAALADKGAAAVARNYAQLASESDKVGGTMREYEAGFSAAAEKAGGDYAKAVEYALPKEPTTSPDKRTYLKLAPKGGKVVGGVWEPNKRPFVGEPGKVLSEDDLVDEGEKDELRAEYDTLMGDDDGESREAYVEIMMEQRKKAKEAKDAAKP